MVLRSLNGNWEEAYKTTKTTQKTHHALAATTRWWGLAIFGDPALQHGAIATKRVFAMAQLRRRRRSQRAFWAKRAIETPSRLTRWTSSWA